jgi:hypothetical protein
MCLFWSQSYRVWDDRFDGICVYFSSPLHTAIINGNTEVVNNLLDVMQTMPNLWLKINAYNNLLQVEIM